MSAYNVREGYREIVVRGFRSCNDPGLFACIRMALFRGGVGVKLYSWIFVEPVSELNGDRALSHFFADGEHTSVRNV